MLINCPECSKEVSDNAESCPSCGYKLSEEVKDQLRSSKRKQAEQAEHRANHNFIVKVIFYAVLLLTLFVLWRACSSSLEEAGNAGLQCDQANARVAAQMMVKERLKNPSSADFGPISQWKFETTDHTHWKVTSWVESTNSFNATIRTPFVANLTCKGDGTWTASSIVFDN